MPGFPLRPNLKQYRGSNERLVRKNRDYNAMAHKVAAYANKLVANNPDEIQQYIFANIAHDLGYSTDEVRSAISTGGYNGITLRVDAEDRLALKGYKASS